MRSTVAGTKTGLACGAIFILAACTGGSGFDSVGDVKNASLHGQTLDAVMEMLGDPYAYYAAPGVDERILVYDTIVTGASLSSAGCILLIGLAGAGGGDCPKGGAVMRRCAAIRFGPDDRVTEISEPMQSQGPCWDESDDRFLPATRRPLEELFD